MQGQDLRQTLVTIGLSIVLADLMLWIFGGEIYTFDPPRADLRLDRAAAWSSKFPTYRLVRAASSAIVIGVGLWRFLDRTRVGMMIRAGVDDRAMLAASGVNVQLVFAVTFAIGAGLAGLRRRRRRHRALDLAGRGHALPARLARRRDRRRHGQRRRRRDRRAADRPGRAVRPRLRADLQRRLHLRDHGRSCSPSGRAGIMGKAGMSAAPWRRGDERGARRAGAMSRAPAGVPARRRPRVARSRVRAATRRRAPARCGRRAARARSGRATSSCWPRVLVYPFGRDAVLHLPDRRPGARARPDRAVAHLPRRLRRHGLAGADDGRRLRRLRGRDLRHQQRRRDQPRLAVVARGRRSRSRSRRCSPPSIGWLSVRTEGIYTIMITLAIGVAFFYLAQQNYTVFNGFQGFSKVRRAGAARRRLARAGAVLLPRAGLRARRLLLRQATWCARRSASRCRASATTRAAWTRSATTSPRTASPPMRSPGVHRRGRRRADGLVQRPHLARHGRHSAR